MMELIILLFRGVDVLRHLLSEKKKTTKEIKNDG